MHESFWNAFKVTELGGSCSNFFDGINLAIEQQKCIVRVIRTVITSKSIIDFIPFREVVIPDTLDRNELLVLCNPIILKRAACFLIDVYKPNFDSNKAQNEWVSRNKYKKPLLLGCYNSNIGFWLIVAVLPESHSAMKNSFGNAFKEAAQRSKARYIHDGLDPTTIWIEKDHLASFKTALHWQLRE